MSISQDDTSRRRCTHPSRGSHCRSVAQITTFGPNADSLQLDKPLPPAPTPPTRERLSQTPHVDTNLDRDDVPFLVGIPTNDDDRTVQAILSRNRPTLPALPRAGMGMWGWRRTGRVVDEENCPPPAYTPTPEPAREEPLPLYKDDSSAEQLDSPPLTPWPSSSPESPYTIPAFLQREGVQLPLIDYVEGSPIEDETSMEQPPPYVMVEGQEAEHVVTPQLVLKAVLFCLLCAFCAFAIFIGVWLGCERVLFQL